MGLMGKYDVFIFDWDGTLSSLKLARALNERLNPRWRYKKSHALDAKGTRSLRVAEKRGEGGVLRSKLLSPFVDLSLLLLKPKLHNDALEVLRELKKKNKKIALLTNGARYRVLRELAILKIEDYFEVIISTQDLNALKPNPLGLEITLRAIKGKRERTLYTGDMVDDIIMAKFAKVTSCAMSCGFDSYGKLRASNPDYIFRSMEEFKKAL
jgi:FMN phosphatase YigB (HAD superfamily)